MDKRIGAQLYTLREFCQTAEDFDDTLKKVSEIGYKIIQVSGIGPISAADIRNRMRHCRNRLNAARVQRKR